MGADFYDVLGTSADASQEDLKKAYRRRVREYHPDVNDSSNADAQFKLVRKAHDVLSSPVERKAYDRIGHRTYVDKHLDALPPLSVFPDIDASAASSSTSSNGSGGTTSGSGGSSMEGSGSSTGSRTSSSSSDGRNSSSSQSSTRTSTSSSSSSTARDSTSNKRRSSGSAANRSSARSEGRSSGSSSSQSSTDTASTATSGTTSRTGTSTSTDSDGASASAQTGRTGTTSQDAGSTTSETTSTSSARSTGGPRSAAQRRRRGLRRWYGVVVLSILGYFAGLGVYAGHQAATLLSTVTRLQSTPAATLTGAFPLSSPTAFALDPVIAGTVTAGAALLAGVVVLPLVVVTTVARFGRGIAWLYALGSLVPAATLAAWPVLPTATWLAVVGLVLAPLFGVGGFLVDVGRYLLATR